MDLGAFSISLAVRDIAASQAFYTQLGFEPIGGDIEQNWLILRNGEHIIGLFQGMFEKNMLTFNPGWNQRSENTESFTDVRAIQAALQDAGVTLDQSTDPDGSGPASIALTDPDGNPILIDQHRD
ncbi:MAG: VOC family protein [Pseudomonadota bacterium]